MEKNQLTPLNWVFIKLGNNDVYLLTTSKNEEIRFTTNIVTCYNTKDYYLFKTENNQFFCEKDRWGVNDEILEKLKHYFGEIKFSVLDKNDNYEKLFD